MTFHLGAWTRGALSEEEAEEARGLLASHGFDRLLVLHGSALEVAGRAAVVVGPCGIGKSAACAELVRSCGGRFLEDGLVVVGEADGFWTLVETGTLAVLRQATRFRSAPRRLLPRGRDGRFCACLHRALDRQAFRAGILLARRGDPETVRRLHRVDRVVVAEEPGPPMSWETDGRTMTVVRDVASRLPGGTELRRLAAGGPAAEVRARLSAALLG